MPDDLDKLNAEVVDEARVIRFPAVPVQLKVPANVCVVPAVKVTVCGAVKVRLLKVVLPLTAGVAPESVTVPELCVNVPSVWVQLPETENVPVGAVNVPAERVNPVTARSAVPTVNVPPEPFIFRVASV